MNFLYALCQERSGNCLVVELASLSIYESIDPVRHRVIGEIVGVETEEEVVDDVD